MKKIILWVALCVAWLSILNPLRAVGGISYDVPRVAIFGGGNPNGGWSVDLQNTDPLTSIEVGLRFKQRDTGATPNDGAGTYYSDTGFSIAGAPRTLWNIEWHANSDASGLTGKNLDDYIFTFMMDTDPSAGQSWVTFNPFNLLLDSSYGNNGTANGAGAENSSPDLNNVGQNSQNGGFPPFSINAFALGTYDARMTATTLGGAPVAQIGITLVVPEAETYVAGIAMTMLVGYGFYRRIRK